MKPRLKIDIVSDVVCPWCYIGCKQLEKALGLMQNAVDVELQWHPFELNRTMPDEGEGIAEHLQRKYGIDAGAAPGQRQQMIEMAKTLGITIRYEEGKRIYNTFRAHRILHWAREQGRQNEFTLALFKAYFEAGSNPSDPTVLKNIAEALSLDANEIDRILDSDRYINEVRAEQNIYTSMGIQGVPTFIVNDKYPVTGAQDAAVMAQMLDKVCAISTAESV